MESTMNISKETMLEVMDGLQQQPASRPARGRLMRVALGLAATALAALGKFPVLVAARALLMHSVLATPAGLAASLTLGGVVAWFASRLKNSPAGLVRLLANLRSRSSTNTPEAHSHFIRTLREAVEHDAIAPANAFGFIHAVESGLMPAEQARGLVDARLSASRA